jgi:para-nitrobenzyl esterase
MPLGLIPVQGVVWGDINLSGVQSSEDCLNLNILTPAAPGEAASLPVMVWIHGGGFVAGSGTEPRYDARAASLSSPSTIVSMRGAFGGDPGKVTIAGESAGSHATSALMASPLAKGLFARVIGESRAMFAAPSRALASLAEAEAAGLHFMCKVGARSRAEMRALPPTPFSPPPGIGFRPIIDGWSLPRSPAKISPHAGTATCP